MEKYPIDLEADMGCVAKRDRKLIHVNFGERRSDVPSFMDKVEKIMQRVRELEENERQRADKRAKWTDSQDH